MNAATQTKRKKRQKLTLKKTGKKRTNNTLSLKTKTSTTLSLKPKTEKKPKPKAPKVDKKAQAKINIAKQAGIQKAKKLAIRVLNKKLKADYPVWNSYLPMQMGVAETIMETFASSGCSRKAMRELIGCHCHSRRYLENITKGKRYDLFTGEEVAEIEEMQINNARFRVGVYDELSSKKAVTKKSSTGA